MGHVIDIYSEISSRGKKRPRLLQVNLLVVNENDGQEAEESGEAIGPGDVSRQAFADDGDGLQQTADGEPVGAGDYVICS